MAGTAMNKVIQLDVRSQLPGTLKLRFGESVRIGSIAELQQSLTPADRCPTAIVIRMRGDDNGVLGLLKILRDRRPQVIRLVAVADASSRFMALLNDYSHYVASLGSSERRIDVLLQHLSTFIRLTRGREAAALFKEISPIPEPSPVVAGITRLIEAQHTVNPAAVGGMFRQDAALLPRMFKLINGREFKLRESVYRADQMVQQLGARNVRDLATFASTMLLQTQPDGWELLPFEQLTRRALQTARLAELLCRDAKTDRVQQNHAFLAGLMAYQGLQQLIVADPQRMTRVFEQASAFKRAVRAQIKLEYGLNHSELAAMMMMLWHVPPRAASAVIYHHRPEDSVEHAFGALAAVHVADAMLPPLKSRDGLLISSTLSNEFLVNISMQSRNSHWARMTEEYLGN